jgi:hypothetical protein
VAGEELSPKVIQFIQQTINSVEQLEVLLYLMSNPDQSWTAAEIGEKLRSTAESVGAKLRDLHQAHLLESKSEKEPRYRYAPRSTALAKEVAESLRKAYLERKDSVIELIYSRPLEHIRIFSDAFNLRKEE